MSRRAGNIDAARSESQRCCYVIAYDIRDRHRHPDVVANLKRKPFMILRHALPPDEFAFVVSFHFELQNLVTGTTVLVLDPLDGLSLVKLR